MPTSVPSLNVLSRLNFLWLSWGSCCCGSCWIFHYIKSTSISLPPSFLSLPPTYVFIPIYLHLTISTCVPCLPTSTYCRYNFVIMLPSSMGPMNDYYLSAAFGYFHHEVQKMLKLPILAFFDVKATHKQHPNIIQTTHYQHTRNTFQNRRSKHEAVF